VLSQFRTSQPPICQCPKKHLHIFNFQGGTVQEVLPGKDCSEVLPRRNRPGSSSMKGSFRGYSKEELSWRFFRGGNVHKFFQGGTVLEVFPRRNCPGGPSKAELSWRFFQGGTVKDLVALQASRQLCQASAQLMGRSEYTNFSSHSSCCTLNRG